MSRSTDTLSKMKTSIPDRVRSILRSKKRKADPGPELKEDPRITSLAEELENVKTEKDVLTEELEKEAGSRRDLEKSLHDRARQFNEDVESLQATVKGLQEELERLEKDKDATDRKALLSLEEVDKEKQVSADLSRQRDEALSAQERAEAEVREVRKHLQDRVEQSLRDRAEVEAARAALEDAERDVQALRELQMDLQTRLAEAEADKQREQKAREEAEDEALVQAEMARKESKAAEEAQETSKRHLVEFAQLNEEMRGLQIALRDLRTEKEKLVEEKRRLETLNADQEDDARNVRIALNSANTSLAELGSELEQAQTNISELKRKVDVDKMVLMEAETRGTRTEEEVLFLRKQIEDVIQDRRAVEEKLQETEIQLQAVSAAEKNSRIAEEKAKLELESTLEQNAEALHALAREKEELEREWRSKLPASTIPPTPEDYEITRRARKFKEGYLHFAVVGMAGCGKSSLVNAFRGIMNDSTNAALTGVQTDLTTTVVGRYNDPRRDCRFIWYDFPGSGSSGISGTDYFNHQGLYVFDCVFLLWDNRLTDADISVLQNCVRLKIPYFLIRTKSDVHIQNIEDVLRSRAEAEDNGAEDPRRRSSRLTGISIDALGKYITQTRQSVELSLRKAGLPSSKVYMVSYKSVLKIMQSGMSFPEGVRVIDERDLLSDILAQRRIKKPRGIPVRSNTTPWS